MTDKELKMWQDDIKMISVLREKNEELKKKRGDNVKYLYLKLNDLEIITFKSVKYDSLDGLHRLYFNGTEGIFVTLNSIQEAKMVVNKIEQALKSDESKDRIISLY